VLVRISLAPVWVRRSPPALGFRRAPGFSRDPAPAPLVKTVPGSSRGLVLSFRGLPSSSGRRLHGAPTSEDVLAPRMTAAPPMRFAPLQRLPARGGGLEDRACLTRSPAPSGFLNLVALRSAPCLPALFHAGSAHGVAPSRALLLSRGRTLSPAPVPSWRLDETVESASPAHRPLPAPRSPLPKQRRARPERRPGPRTGAHQGLTSPRKPPRLQGFAPRESPPRLAEGLGRRGRVALLGFWPSRVLPSRQRLGSRRTSPHGLCLIGRERPMSWPSRVSVAGRWAGLSRDCRPSWALPPCDHHER
jgi:hypothetical protein